MVINAAAASGAAMIGAVGDLMAQATSFVCSATIFYLKVARGAIRPNAAPAEPARDIRARFAADGRANFNISVALADAEGAEVAKFNAEWNLRAAAQRG